MLPFRFAAAAAAAALFACATPTLAAPIGYFSPQTTAPDDLTVGVSGVGQDSFLPSQYSGYGRNISPPVSWKGAPARTRSYALMWEDPDGGPPTPTVHWLAWNIPADVHDLPRSVRNNGEVERPQGMRQGRNSHGGVGYTGPHPPVGGTAHHYHVQVFALDRKLSLKPLADREALLAAMKGHVIGRGQAVVLYAQAADKVAGAR